MNVDSIIKKLETKNPSLVLYGPKGVGKKYTALQIVKATLCGNNPACGTCNECKRIEHENHPDVIIIKPEADEEKDKKGREISISQIREDVLDKMIFSSSEGKKRFVIIDQAHRLNRSSGNALLKSVEEPPKDTIFMLLTPNLYSMLPTILSRCELISIPPLSNEKLAQISKVPVDHKLIGYADGSVSALKFYLSIEEDTQRLIDFMDAKDRSFSDISSISSSLAESVKGATKAEDMENAEYVFSFIIKHLLNKAQNEPERAKAIVPVIQEINTISKKLYTNTSISMVIENMLLELVVRSI